MGGAVRFSDKRGQARFFAIAQRPDEVDCA